MYLNSQVESSLPTEKNIRSWFLQEYKTAKATVVKELAKAQGQIHISFETTNKGEALQNCHTNLETPAARTTKQQAQWGAVVGAALQFALSIGNDAASTNCQSAKASNQSTETHVRS